MAQNPEREKDFKNLDNLTIMDSLTKGQYDRIKKIFTGPKPKQIKKGVAENLKKIDFPDKLMGLGLLSETDLGKLKEALIDIDECDLLDLINEYEVKYGLAAVGGGGGGGSSGNATAGSQPQQEHEYQTAYEIAKIIKDEIQRKNIENRKEPGEEVTMVQGNQDSSTDSSALPSQDNNQEMDSSMPQPPDNYQQMVENTLVHSELEKRQLADLGKLTEELIKDLLSNNLDDPRDLESNVEISIWDFAGQGPYYTCHKATVQVCTKNSKEKAFENYKNEMNKVCGLDQSYLSPDILYNEHEKYKEEAITKFKEARKIGRQRNSDTFLETLKKEITIFYENSKKQNEVKKEVVKNQNHKAVMEAFGQYNKLIMKALKQPYIFPESLQSEHTAYMGKAINLFDEKAEGGEKLIKPCREQLKNLIETSYKYFQEKNNKKANLLDMAANNYMPSVLGGTVIAAASCSIPLIPFAFGAGATSLGLWYYKFKKKQYKKKKLTRR